jgi:hypothetical protein
MTKTALLTLLFVVSLAGLSRADAVSPDVWVCNGLSLGNACKTDTGISGTCQDSTCYAKDMEHWDRDAGGYPPMIPVACLECLPKGAATGTSTSTDGDTKDSSGCSVGGARVIAPWLLAGIFATCVTLLRRRPR